MTLFFDVAKDFLIKNIQDLITESNNADERSATFGAFMGKRDLTLSASKRAILADLMLAINTISTDTDESNQNTLVACIGTTEAALKTTRSKENQAPASTEKSLLHLKEFIRAFHTKLETLTLLDKNCPKTPDPVFHLYRAIARYFAARLSDGAIKTNNFNTTLQWLSDHPSVTYKQAFLMAIDGIAEQRLQRLQKNLAGQKPKTEDFKQIKCEAVDDCLEHLSLKHEALRHDKEYLNSLGQPLNITFLLGYLDDAKNMLNLDVLSLENFVKTNTHGLK